MKTPPRISLAEISRAEPKVLADVSAGSVADGGRPTLRDITECLFFSPGDGRIWLNDQRMVLLHNSSLGSLRRELIEGLGMPRARGLLTRAGYASGSRDARMVRERWPGANADAVLTAGTRLHSLEGIVKVEVVRIEASARRGQYYGEFLWHHASEDDEHIAAYGLGTEPACWMQVGYAMGFVTTLFGRLIIFREVECRSMGSAVCKVVGKPAEAWGDVSEDLRYLNAEAFLSTSAYSPVTASAAALPGLEAGTGEAGARHMVGMSSAFNAACHRLRRVAPTRATVLFIGESGVGKELFARMLHDTSPRSSAPFVSINCAAIPDTLVESELFGVERGAFTGAGQSRPGRFERADGGTLFLDEIASLSLVAQGKLLRALQEGEIERVGGVRQIRVDVRVVAASNVDLAAEVRAGRFREDLFYRLNVFPIRLPALRERRDDIPLLLSHFRHRYNHLHGRRASGYTIRAVQVMLNYPFPGNIRELQNLVERAVIATDDDNLIDVPHLFSGGEMPAPEMLAVADGGGLTDASQEAAAPAPPGSLLDSLLAGRQDGSGPSSLEAVERELVREALARTGGNISAAARLLGMTRRQLSYRLRRPQ